MNDTLPSGSLQELYLRLLPFACAPVPGPRILADLRSHRGDVQAAIFGRMPQKTWIEGPGGDVQLERTPGCLRHLRSVAFDRYDGDRLWVLPSGDAAARRLKARARSWGATVSVGPPEREAEHETAGTPPELLTFAWTTPDLQLSLPPEPPSLSRQGEATPAAIQLALLKKTSFNELDGPAVVAALLAHRELWRGIHLGISDSILQQGNRWIHEPTRFHGLTGLARHPDDHSADQLWALCPTKDAARALVRLSKAGWSVSAHSTKIWSRASSRRTAGSQGDEHVVSFWWD